MEKRRARVSKITEEYDCEDYINITFRTTNELDVESTPIKRVSDEFAKTLSEIMGQRIPRTAIEGMEIEELRSRVVGKECLIEFKPMYFLQNVHDMPKDEDENQREKRFMIEEFCSTNLINPFTDEQSSYVESLLDEYTETLEEAIQTANRKIQSTKQRAFTLKSLISICATINERDRIQWEKDREQMEYQQMCLEQERQEHEEFMRWHEEYVKTDEYRKSCEEGQQILANLKRLCDEKTQLV